MRKVRYDDKVQVTSGMSIIEDIALVTALVGQVFIIYLFFDMLDDTKYLSNWYPSYLPEMGEFIEVLVTEEQQKMLLGRQSPQEMLDRLAEFLNRAQNRYVDNYGPNTPRPLSIL